MENPLFSFHGMMPNNGNGSLGFYKDRAIGANWTERIDNPLYEVINGARVEKPTMGKLAAASASVLLQYLALFAVQHNLGLVVSEMLFRLPGVGKSRRPDLAFVAYDRWAWHA